MIQNWSSRTENLFSPYAKQPVWVKGETQLDCSVKSCLLNMQWRSELIQYKRENKIMYELSIGVGNIGLAHSEIVQYAAELAKNVVGSYNWSPVTFG